MAHAYMSTTLVQYSYTADLADLIGPRRTVRARRARAALAAGRRNSAGDCDCKEGDYDGTRRALLTTGRPPLPAPPE